MTGDQGERAESGWEISWRTSSGRAALVLRGSTESWKIIWMLQQAPPDGEVLAQPGHTQQSALRRRRAEPRRPL